MRMMRLYKNQYRSVIIILVKSIWKEEIGNGNELLCYMLGVEHVEVADMRPVSR